MMAELLIVLIVLLVVLAVVTVVGHGVWVVMAWVFGGGRRRRRAHQRKCAFCGRVTPEGSDRCEWCGRDLQSPLAAEMDDLKAFERQLKRFEQEEMLRPKLVENLLARLSIPHDNCAAHSSGGQPPPIW